nr:MAG TPA: hypothetical protein [Caudoviricetes sp.]DAY31415.1 MAG TPA: hypothetical protein [Caudoviricetes sp.]
MHNRGSPKVNERVLIQYLFQHSPLWVLFSCLFSIVGEKEQDRNEWCGTRK